MLPFTACASLWWLLTEIQGQVTPAITAARTPEAIVIDGHLNEAAWSRAGRIAELTQVEPFEGQAARAETEVLILFDEAHLYLAFRCHESDPADIVRQQMKRDGLPRDDDRVEWILDTFHDGRNGYRFQVTAAGGRRDALISNNGIQRNPRWDGIWAAKTRVDEQGWTAEVAIPFNILAFGQQETWGFNVQRYRGRERTQDRWATPSRAVRFATISAAGDLQGLTGLRQGLGLEFRPYIRAARNRDSRLNDTDLLFDVGGELTWRITPELTGSITLNTDFAETEVDDLQVNLSRFPLFFPEKRDFFLEDASLFAFGPLRFERETPDFLPYNSRTIGLVNGQPTALEGGARLAGRIGPVELGFLGVRTAEDRVPIGSASFQVPESDLAVLRPSLAIAKGMQVGAFLTAGDPVSESAAQTVGLDYRYQSNKLFDGVFGLNVYAMRSFDGQLDQRDVAYGIQTRVETDNWDFIYEGTAVGDDFRPALGFIRRRGFHKHRLTTRYQPYTEEGHFVRSFQFQVDPVIYTDLSNELESYRVILQFFGVELHSGDRFDVALIPEGDRPAQGFAPVPGSIIPAGEHDWWQARAQLQTATNRIVSALVRFQAGGWYDEGSLSQITLAGEFRPSPRLRVAIAYNESRGKIPGGDFVTRIERVNLDWLLSPDLYWENLAQSDNVSRTLGIQSRIRWIHQDGRELFVVMNAGWVDTTRALIPTGSGLTVKAIYSIRF